MYNFLTRNGQVLAFGLGILLTIIFLATALGGLEDFNLLSKEDQKLTTIFNFGLGAAIFLTVICAVLAILFGIYQLLTNLKGSMVGLIGIAALLILFLIAYNTATVETSGSIFRTMQKFNVTEGQSKFISGAITTAISMAAIAAAAFVISEVRNFFK